MRKATRLTTSKPIAGNRATRRPLLGEVMSVGNISTTARTARRRANLRTRLSRLIVRTRTVNASARAAERPQNYTTASHLFDYPTGLPLAVEIVGSRYQDGATVDDVAFPSPSGDE